MDVMWATLLNTAYHPDLGNSVPTTLTQWPRNSFELLVFYENIYFIVGGLQK